MKSLAELTKGVIIVAMTTLIGSAPVLAGTFVYVSNADDGGSTDRRFLYAAARSKPYSVFVYAIDPNTGALNTL